MLPTKIYRYSHFWPFCTISKMLW